MKRRIVERCDLCKGNIGKVAMLLAGSRGIICGDCALYRRAETLELEWQMAEEYQKEYDALVKSNHIL